MGSTEEKSSTQAPTLPSKEVELPPTEFQIKPKEIIKLVKNDGAREVYKMVRKTEKTMITLTDIVKKTGLDYDDLVVVFSKIPVENEEGSDSLSESGEAIIAVSDAVDKKYPDMPAHEKTALKLNTMGDLLKSKAELLESNN